MASIEDLLSQIPIKQIADQLGVDETTATTAVQSAVPTLLGGLQANAADPGGAASLLNALGDHGSLLDGGVDVNEVDTADGSKIVNNVFGGSKEEVVNTLGGVGGVGNDLVKQLLPILAPIVLAYVAKQLGGAGGAAAPAPQQQQSAGGALGDVLGGLLRGTTGGGGGGGLGGVLGGLLGSNAGGALGSVLGGLLGAGKR